MKIVFRLAWRNLWRQPRRTWLTTGAMIFANMLLVFMISLQFGMYSLMIDNALQVFTGHMQVQAPLYNDEKKMRQTVPNIVPLANAIREELQSDKVAARGWAFALASSDDRSFGIGIYGVEPEFENNVSNIPGLTSLGRYLGDNDAAEIVMGSVLARNLHVEVGDEITLMGSGVDGSFAAAVVNIVGIFDSGVTDIDRNIAEIPLGFFQDTFFMEGAGHQVVVFGDGLAAVPELKSRVQSVLPGDSDLVMLDWDALQPGLKQAIQADMSSAFFMYFVLVILVSFSVLNTQLMSVLERTREFGIVMALGLKPGKLGRLVILETAMMGLLGVVLGVAAGALVTAWFTTNGLAFPGMDEMAAKFNLPARMYPQINALTLLAGPITVFIFTMLASIYPAVRLHWQNPVDAMRVA
ncbi:MAG: FtsX-like permease family protein [Gammaproteobacteria bacterium]|nr:FtsX-like permease family protein [Gammaproteobacteria bacterium]